MQDRNLPEPNKYYSAGAIVKANFLGDWVGTRRQFLNVLKSERAIELFKPIIFKGEKYTRYKIKGQNILEVIKLIDAGELTL